jgi:hypothetical protein
MVLYLLIASILVLGGRTYPLEGAMTIFPQKAPYTDPLRILLCGGSTPLPAKVLDNCVSIEPEAVNPTWTLERMVCPHYPAQGQCTLITHQN